MTDKKVPERETEAKAVELDLDVLDQVSGGVLIRESGKEKDRKTTDKAPGDIVLPEI